MYRKIRDLCTERSEIYVQKDQRLMYRKIRDLCTERSETYEQKIETYVQNVNKISYTNLRLKIESKSLSADFVYMAKSFPDFSERSGIFWARIH